jgi:hypothetical protein
MAKITPTLTQSAVHGSVAETLDALSDAEADRAMSSGNLADRRAALRLPKR